MGRPSTLLKAHSALLLRLINKIDALHGYPGGLDQLGLPPHDYTCWWRWRTGKRMFSVHVARVLVNHFITTSALFRNLSKSNRITLMSLSARLDPALTERVVKHIELRTRDAHRIRTLVDVVSQYDTELGGRLRDLADKQEAYVQAYRDNDFLVVSILYRNAADAIYIEGVLKSNVPQQLAAIDEAHTPRRLRVRKP